MDLASIQIELHNALRSQMTRATYDTHIAGAQLIEAGPERWLLATSSAQSLEWLQSPRLYPLIEAAAHQLADRPVTVEIELAQNGRGRHEPPPPEPVEVGPALVDAPDPAAGIVSSADHIAAFFKRGGAGYRQVTHHVTKYRLPLMDSRAASLWSILESEDKRPLDAIAPNFWTPPHRYSFGELIQKLNQKKHEIISGYSRECKHTQDNRQDGRPVICPAGCCWKKEYQWVRHRPHFTGKGSVCERWVPGLLEILSQQKLLRVHFLSPNNYKPEIQIWRMPSLLTPYLYDQMEPLLQKEYDVWLDQYLPLFDLKDRREWGAIRRKYLEPLMPGYDQHEIDHNYEIYKRRAEFFEGAIRNPNHDGHEKIRTHGCENLDGW